MDQKPEGLKDSLDFVVKNVAYYPTRDLKTAFYDIDNELRKRQAFEEKK